MWSHERAFEALGIDPAVDPHTYSDCRRAHTYSLRVGPQGQPAGLLGD